MKKLIFSLALGLLLACGGFAQNKKAEKLLWRGNIWVPDKEAILKVLEGKAELARMQRDMENGELFLQFSKDLTGHTGERGRIKRMEWRASPDGKSVRFQGIELVVKELTANKFVFLIEKREDLPLTFIPASKDTQATLLKKIKEGGGNKEMPKEEKAVPPVEEKKN